MLAKLLADQALRKAQSHVKKGEVAEAQKIYQSVFKSFSKQAKDLQENFVNLNNIKDKNLIKNPPQEVVNKLISLYKNGQFSIVVEQAQALVKQYPETFIFWNILGASAVQIGMADQAIIALKKVISMEPNYADAYSNISVALQEQGKLDEAIDACKKAVLLNPNHATAYNNLGNALKDQGKLDRAINAYNKSISLKSDYADAYYNKGNALRDKGELDKAIDEYKNAISFNFNNSSAYNNMGLAFKDLGKTKEAIDAYKKSISFNPDFAETHLNLGYVFLNNGKVLEGLEEYEWRWKTKKGLSLHRQFYQPQWDGQANLKDKTILIWHEQGIGDTINWSAYLPFVCSRAKHVIVECPKKLMPLLTLSFPNIEVKSTDRSLDAERKDFDLHLPMGSLYKVFLNEIMGNYIANAYIAPDPNRVRFWQNRLHSLGKGPYVGISWKSSNMSLNRLPNYLSIYDLFPLLKLPNITFINLQNSGYEDDLVKVKDELGVTVHNFDDIDHFDDLLDVASLSSALDIVITNKTTVSFISAGVGTSTKIANWKQSPWNNILLNPVGPLVNIFERNGWDTWENVINLIAKDLKI